MSYQLRQSRSLDSLRSSSASHRSSRCSSHNSSKMATMLAEHSARLAAAKSRLRFADQDAKLLRKEADLKAERLLLSSEMEVHEAEASFNAMKQFDIDCDSYITIDKLPESDHECDEPSQHPDTAEYLSFARKPTYDDPVTLNRPSDTNDDIEISPGTHTMNPCAPAFEPTLNQSPIQNICSDFSRYVVKKDLLSSRLTRFDDNPEFFNMWKGSFKSVSSELNLSATEELDLLVKWLGPSSEVQAKRIRAAHSSNPIGALSKIWERLEDRYNRPEMVTHAINQKLANFPKLSNRDTVKLYDLADIVSEIEGLKGNPRFSTHFSVYDSSTGVNTIVNKVPFNIQEKWAREVNTYRQRHDQAYPGFNVFAQFLHNVARQKNDPALIFDEPKRAPVVHVPRRVSSAKTDIASNSNTVSRPGSSQNLPSRISTPQNPNLCPIHGTNHSLNSCRAFRAKPMSERLDFLRKNGYCDRCCGSKKHSRTRCHEKVVCDICHSANHPTALHETTHQTQPKSFIEDPKPTKDYEGEIRTNITSSCTQICGDPHTSKSCAKILLVRVYPTNCKNLARTVYCMIDDQSNQSLANSDFFNEFGENGTETTYSIVSCAGKFNASGRIASGYTVESLDGSQTLKLPKLLECNDIPQNRDEIPSPSVTRHYKHLKALDGFIPPINKSCRIELLIGRDLMDAHIVLEHCIGSPYAQRLPLGWVVIGDICLGKSHPPTTINVNKISVLQNGRPTICEPCENSFDIKEEDLFKCTAHDEKPGFSIEDQTFLDIMKSGFNMSNEGKWTAPLPFRQFRPILDNNREMAMKRAISFDKNLQANEEKASQVVEFMTKLFTRGHAERAAPLDQHKEVWYLPLFAVYHPKKPKDVRIVFDSSAKFHGNSLNDVLLTGPDLCNSLLGILMRFRKEKIAVTVDVEQMFHNFQVQTGHRDYLRFLWHEDNDLTKPLVDHRMTVHTFGNGPSPAVATYGLRKAVEYAENDVRQFVCDNFYVDDGLISCSSPTEAVDLVKRSQKVLRDNGRLRLHKVISNSRQVLDAFPTEDLNKNIKELDFGTDNLPLQRSLGLHWDTETDSFTFRTSVNRGSFTRRGILSIINSVFDPLGFASPVMIKGKLLMQEIMSTMSDNDWDKPLPDSFLSSWNSWVNTLTDLENVHIPRQYVKASFENADKREVHIYADASRDVVAAVAYLRLIENDTVHTNFLLGKAKVAPSRGLTIPRMELCAAVLAIDIANIIKEHLHIDSDAFTYYSDSQITLGYITNETRRFYVFVGNRVNRIRAQSSPSQWKYVPSCSNPADVATRSIAASELQNSLWLRGPDISTHIEQPANTQFSLVHPDNDKEVRPIVTTKKTIIHLNKLGTERFKRFSNWNSILRGVHTIKRFLRHEKLSQPSDLKDTEHTIIRILQHEVYSKEVLAVEGETGVPRNSSLLPLNPISGPDKLLRVGGRINRAKGLSCTPIILPKHHHITQLIVRHFHEKVAHQGRQLTEGAIRNAGYWVIGCKRLVSSVISKCVTCKRLRGKFGWQQMSDLPEDRLEPGPPFSHVGIDTFGPWHVVSRRTRGGVANQKRWAILFTCLVTRGIHIELVEELSAASFINALRRFIAIRGPVATFRSDRGTNFVGASKELDIDSSFVEQTPVAGFLRGNGAKWIFNPPHASHFGCVWERMIQSCRRILDSLLLNHKAELTHEVLSTFMMEVCAILNSRPLVPITSDPETLSVLSPSLVLTQKGTLPDNHALCDISVKDALRSSWKRVQHLANMFWTRWRRDYIQQLQVRQKWFSATDPFKTGDIVLIKDCDSHRNLWPLGRVTRTFLSEDNQIRKVELKRSDNGTLCVRPISQLVRLLESD